MRKRLDDLFSALMLAAGVAVVLAGWWCLSHSIARAGETTPIPVASPCIRLPDPESEPEPAPEPTPTYDPAVPLSAEIQAVPFDACAERGVPVALALGVIHVESRFQTDADNGKCYGLMQLNRDYFPDKLSPEDNIREGVAYLGRLLEEYGDTAAALTAYTVGYDAGGRTYAGAVLEAAERWGG